MRQLRLGMLLLGAFAGGCGYGPARDLSPARGALSVAAGEALVPDAQAREDVATGARAMLARRGALSAASYPRMVVELLRVEEATSGIVDRGGEPVGRGVVISLTGRAFLQGRPGGPEEADTGWVRVSGGVESGLEIRADTLHRDDSVRGLARRLGEALAERVLGYHAPRAE